jgi:hypothetical protein
MEPLRGSCMCGKVRYELRGPPRVAYYCHCGKCRKQSGSAFAINVTVLKEHLAFTEGEAAIASWVSSPGKRRYFASCCGSPLYSHGETKPYFALRCGTLDGVEMPVAPSAHAFVAHKAHWDRIMDDLPQHSEYIA